MSLRTLGRHRITMHSTVVELYVVPVIGGACPTAESLWVLSTALPREELVAHQLERSLKAVGLSGKSCPAGMSHVSLSAVSVQAC